MYPRTCPFAALRWQEQGTARDLGHGRGRAGRARRRDRVPQNCTLQTVGRLAKALKCEPGDLFLFRAQTVAEALSRLDARYVDFWNAADEPTKRKAIRIFSELL